MDELDLQCLADEPAPSGLILDDPRPVEVVLHRSRQIRRRRRGAGVVGAALLLAGVIGARALAPDTAPKPGKVSNSVAGLCTRDPETSLIAPRSSPGPNVPLDQIDVEGGPAVPRQNLPPRDVGDLLLLPGEVPDGMTVDLAKGWSGAGDCPDGPLLSLESDGADGTIDATIRLLGPYRRFDFPSFAGAQSFEPIQLRGSEAWVTSVPYPGQPLTVVSWTDPTGVSWILEGEAADRSTLLAVAEALRLDARSSPPAALPDGAVRPGGG